MTRIRIISFSVAVLLAGAAAQAQQEQPREMMPAQTDSHSQGTAPDGMGSSGWTGGTGGSHIGKGSTTGSGSVANSSPADQPLMATGQDLKGPPTRFPANNTPE